LVGAYGLTTGSAIVEALVRAKGRAVDIRLMTDKTTPCERANEIEPVAAAGVPIWIDDQARIAHVKTMVIDRAVTLTGSMNWTRGPARWPWPEHDCLCKQQACPRDMKDKMFKVAQRKQNPTCRQGYS
jgi:hypothetical protein